MQQIEIMTATDISCIKIERSVLRMGEHIFDPQRLV